MFESRARHFNLFTLQFLWSRVQRVRTTSQVNTKSSTEAELIRVDDAMTFVMWMKHFFQSQVKDLNDPKLNQYGKHIIIKQDNTSAIQLERNGWKSSTKRTKHINVWYFYITDQLKKGKVSEVVYKPTEDMTSDYLTKALQGKLFIKHRETLMGLDGIDEYQFYRKYKESQQKG